MEEPRSKTQRLRHKTRPRVCPANSLWYMHIRPLQITHDISISTTTNNHQTVPPTPSLPPQPRKQPQRIPPINLLPVFHPHLAPIQIPRIHLNNLIRRIRKIGPKKNPPRLRKLPDQRQLLLIPTQRQIKIKPPRLLHHLLRTLLIDEPRIRHRDRCAGDNV